MENHHKKIKLKVLVVFGSLVILILALTLTRSYILDNAVAVEESAQNSESSTQKPQQSLTITKSKGSEAKLNFQQINFDISSILDDPLVQDLPKSASIELKLGETSYTLSKDSVSLGKPASPDITISVPSQYTSYLSSGVCETIKKASNDGVIGIQTHSSEAALLWKYKGMMKYKGCLG